MELAGIFILQALLFYCFHFFTGLSLRKENSHLFERCFTGYVLNAEMYVSCMFLFCFFDVEKVHHVTLSAHK